MKSLRNIASPLWTAFDSAVQFAALLLLVVGILATTVMALAGFADLVGSLVFARPLQGVLELTEILLVVIVFGGISYAQLEGKNIAVELTFSLGRVFGFIISAAGQIIAILFFSLIAWRGHQAALESFRVGEYTQGAVAFPVYPVRYILAFSAAVAALASLRALLVLVGSPSKQQKGEQG